VSHRHGDLQLMASVPPPASDIRCEPPASDIHAIGLPQLPQGVFVHLGLTAKHNGYSFHVSKGSGNHETRLTRLTGVAAVTLCKYAKAHP
jgi:hypothetical protein